jgi:hypothetical protein
MRELSRRVTRWVPFVQASVPNGWIITQPIPSPSQSRGEGEWRIDDVIAGATIYDPAAIILPVTSTLLFVTAQSVADSVTPWSTPGQLQDLFSRFPDADVVGSSDKTSGLPVELDFHPFTVNPRETLGLSFRATNPSNPFAGNTSGLIGYTLSYTLLSTR